MSLFLEVPFINWQSFFFLVSFKLVLAVLLPGLVGCRFVRRARFDAVTARTTKSGSEHSDSGSGGAVTLDAVAGEARGTVVPTDGSCPMPEASSAPVGLDGGREFGADMVEKVVTKKDVDDVLLFTRLMTSSISNLSELVARWKSMETRSNSRWNGMDQNTNIYVWYGLRFEGH
jgi:hypothetical protein